MIVVYAGCNEYSPDVSKPPRLIELRDFGNILLHDISPLDSLNTSFVVEGFHLHPNNLSGISLCMSKNPHAVALGRLGGKAKSKRKKLAVRENGNLGGRPTKP